MFSKKPDSLDRPTGSSGVAGSTFSVLGPDIVIDGNLVASADLHLDGKISGDIKCAELVQGETSQITGCVIASSARVAGRISGSITADVLVIQKTARIEGDVFYGSLTIEEGAQVDGKFARHQAETEPKLMLAGGTEAV